METENKGVSIGSDGRFIYPEIKAETTTEDKKVETAEVKTEEKKIETPVSEEKKVETTPVTEVKVETPVKVETETEKKVETAPVAETVVQNENEEFFENELTPDVITKKLDDYGQKHFQMSYHDAIRYKAIDIDKHVDQDSLSVIKHHMQQLANNKLSEAEIIAQTKKYDLIFIESDEDYEEYIKANNLSEQNILDIEADYEKKLREAVDYIKEKQSKINFSEVRFKAKTPTKPEEPKKEDFDKALRDVAGNYLKTFTNEEITIKNEKGEDLAKITIEATEAEKTKTLEAVAKFDTRWLNPDGTLNEKKFVREIHRLENYDKDMRLSYQAGIDKGKKSEAMDVHNIIQEKSETPGELKSTPKVTAADVALANLGMK